MKFESHLVNVCRELGLEVSREALEGCLAYFRLLEKWRPRISLLTVSDPEELARFHFAESFWAGNWIRPGARIADVGSGAGFPGIPLAIFRSDLEVTLLERNFKKAVFLETVVRELKLGSVQAVVTGDAADWPGWTKIDVATMRALKPWPALTDRLAGTGSELLLLRGPGEASGLGGWTCLEEVLYPASRQRVVTRYRPPVVPRETTS